MPVMAMWLGTNKRSKNLWQCIMLFMANFKKRVNMLKADLFYGVVEEANWLHLIFWKTMVWSIRTKTGIISSIPNKLPDIGYGHDLPKSLSASEAYELLKKDVAEFENAVATGVNANLTQDQFNALVGLRYNVGSLGEIDGLLLYLENGSYEKSKLKKLINDHYDAIIKKKPDKEKYRNGWYRRTETTISIFFDGNYGDMPIDAVRGKVTVQW